MQHIFVFINPKSGAKLGEEMCQLGVRQLDFQTSHSSQTIRNHYYNIMDTEELNAALALIFEIQSSQEVIRVIIAGGDGSVLIVLENFIKTGIIIDKCHFCMLPLGTGNHLSWNFGWGNTVRPIVSKMGFVNLKNLLDEWMKASVQELDVWDLYWECYENGGFKRTCDVKGEGKTVCFLQDTLPDGGEVNSLVYRGKMTNYFSFGYDAELGFAFEKERKKTRLKNMMTYLVKGCKLAMKKPPKVTDIIENIEKMKYIDDPDAPGEKKLSPEYLIFLRKRVIDLQALNSLSKDLYRDMKNVSVILFLNISSYGGHKFVWNYRDAFWGVSDNKNGNFGPIGEQKVDDGLLEMIGFDYPFSLLKGKADRILQTEGPIEVKFFKAPVNSPPITTFFEVNGEHYEVIAPKRVLISKSKYPEKMKFLKKENRKEK